MGLRVRLLSAARRLRTRMMAYSCRSVLTHGDGLHLGARTRIWAPRRVVIGNQVYLGKEVHIEANCRIGHYCLLANRVAIIGRHDHDFTAVGFPVRFSPWIGSRRFPTAHTEEEAVIEDDVWVGFGAIVLTGTTVGRGSVIAAGSVVTRDIPPYSIAAGAPARVVGKRFADHATIERHEAAIRAGQFRFSERGYDASLIQPGLVPGSQP